MSAGDALAGSLPPIALVVGKGGVGKTTCAAALALASAVQRDTLLLTTDPAHALPQVLAQEIGAEPTAITGIPRLSARLLDAPTLRDAFMARWRSVLSTILDRGTYLDATDIDPLVETALPGGDEIFSALELARLVSDDAADREGRIIVDTAPTGHTLRLLALPQTFRALVRLLDAMQDKHRFMVRTLMRSYRADDADRFLAAMRRQVDGLEATLKDPSRCGAVLVTGSDDVVMAETRRYCHALGEMGIAVTAAVWNGEGAAGELPVARRFFVPRLPQPPIGHAGLRQWLSALRPAGAASERAPVPGNPASRANLTDEAHGGIIGPDFLPPLTIVGGKGGVGKTTVAAALALIASDRLRTLVVSTDPAPSLADALAQPIGDADTPIAGAERLHARQMDATAAFSRLRDEYSARVDALFASLMGSGVNLDRDHAIARDLLALAPPGVDEVYALSLLADALFQDRYERVIVDPAPTGHLLRLLDMPQLALAWTHQLMRLMLRYKDVAGLGDTARDLLGFAKDLRRLDAVLRDPGRCGLVLVSLDEPVVRAESERLARAASERQIELRAVVHNRATVRSLPVGHAGVQVVAPALAPPPMGVDAIRAWSATWSLLPARERSTRTK